MRIVVSKMACHSSLPNYVISKCVDDKINNIIRKAHMFLIFVATRSSVLVRNFVKASGVTV